MRFLPAPKALKNPCLVSTKNGLLRSDRDGGIDEFQALGGLTRLMQQKAKKMQGIGMLRVCFEDLQIERGRSRKIARLMFLQCLIKQDLRAFIRHFALRTPGSCPLRVALHA